MNEYTNGAYLRHFCCSLAVLKISPSYKMLSPSHLRNRPSWAVGWAVISNPVLKQLIEYGDVLFAFE